MTTPPDKQAVQHTAGDPFAELLKKHPLPWRFSAPVHSDTPAIMDGRGWAVLVFRPDCELQSIRAVAAMANSHAAMLAACEGAENPANGGPTLNVNRILFMAEQALDHEGHHTLAREVDAVRSGLSSAIASARGAV